MEGLRVHGPYTLTTGLDDTDYVLDATGMFAGPVASVANSASVAFVTHVGPVPPIAHEGTLLFVSAVCIFVL